MYRLVHCRPRLLERWMVTFLWLSAAMYLIRLVHDVVKFPIDDPRLIYQAAYIVISVGFFGLTLPMIVLTCISELRSKRRYGQLDRDDPRHPVHEKWRQIAGEIRRSRVVFADPNYRVADEFVVRETSHGWQLYLTVFRCTMADRARLQSVLQLVRLTTEDRYFYSPGEAIQSWIDGFSLAGQHAEGMIYRIDGCEYSIRYVLKHVLYAGTRIEHLDGKRSYQHALDRLTVPEQTRLVRRNGARLCLAGQ